MTKVVESEDKIAARAARFGVVVPSAKPLGNKKQKTSEVTAKATGKPATLVDDPEKMKKRLDRFGVISQTVVKTVEEQKKQARAERFNIDVTEKAAAATTNNNRYR